MKPESRKVFLLRFSLYGLHLLNLLLLSCLRNYRHRIKLFVPGEKEVSDNSPQQ